MNLAGTYMPDALSEALGWTIMHSLWQGGIIGLITLILFNICRQATPQFKYLTGVFSMLAIFASSIFTFYLKYQPESGFTSSSIISVPETLRESIIELPAVGSRMTLTDIFPWLTILWMLGVLILSVRLAGGLALVNRLRKVEISPLPQAWNQKIDLLINKSGIKRSIDFVLSGKVQVPTVIGIFRPVVLIPAGIISLLPVDQLEAVLVHEIAHIRRHDFLINIVQSLIEALFFYHPVVWIISRSVRMEREQCCDDIAVSICGKLSVYARALAGLSEIQVRTTVPSVALSGNKNKLIVRVERLLKQKKMKNNASEKIVAGILILGSAMILTFSTGAVSISGQSPLDPSPRFNLQVFEKEPAPQAETEPSAATFPAGEVNSAIQTGQSAIALNTHQAENAGLAGRADPPVTADTTLKPSGARMDVKDNIVSRSFVNKEGEEINMKLTIRNGEVKELYVNDVKIPESGYGKYEMEIDRTLDDLSDMEADLQRAKKEIEEIDLEEIKAQVQADMERFRQQDMAKIQEELLKLQEQQIDIQIDHKAMQEEIEKAIREARIDREQIQEEMKKAREEAKKAREEYRNGAENWSEEDIMEMEEEIAKAMEQLEAINMDELMGNLEKELLEIREIDTEEMKKEIESAMEEIDFEKIEREMAEAMAAMEHEYLQIDEEKLKLAGELKSLDELLEELEKLELKED